MAKLEKKPILIYKPMVKAINPETSKEEVTNLWDSSYNRHIAHIINGKNIYNIILPPEINQFWYMVDDDRHFNIKQIPFSDITYCIFSRLYEY